jgi:hypothetical protein
MRQATTSRENFDKSPAPLAAAFAVGAALFPPLGVTSATSIGYRALRIVKVSLLFAPPPLAATAAALGRHGGLKLWLSLGEWLRG